MFSVAVGQRGRDLADHVRHVLVDDAQARDLPGASGSTASGKLHRVANVAGFQELTQLVSDHHRAVVFSFVGRGAQVRGRDDLRSALERIRGKVADVGMQRAGGQRVDNGLLVDDRIAREVQHRRPASSSA